MSDNYPAGAHNYTGGNSPFADDSGLEDAHTAEMQEIESNIDTVALIISELPTKKYDDMVTDINESLGVIGRFMSDSLDSVDCDEWQLVIARLAIHAQLPVNAGSVIEEAISDYAMDKVLNK